VLASGLAASGIVIGLAPREASVVLAVLGLALLGWLLLYGANRLAYHEFIEAVDLLLAAPSRARSVIRTQIVLRDLVAEIREICTLPELNALLQESASQLGVARIALERPTRLQEILSSPSAELRTIWCPLQVATWRVAMPNVLVVTSPRHPHTRAGAVERIVRLLEPELEAWLTVRESDPIADEIRIAAEAGVAAGGHRRDEWELELVRAVGETDGAVTRGLRPGAREVSLNASRASAADAS
jgi:hypothetical protein